VHLRLMTMDQNSGYGWTKAARAPLYSKSLEFNELSPAPLKMVDGSNEPAGRHDNQEYATDSSESRVLILISTSAILAV